jgi:RHS repeat-associated protein
LNGSGPYSQNYQFSIDNIVFEEINETVINRIDYVADYFPYGKMLRHFNGTEERYLTTQHERDQETGLDYRGARYYDADVARFLSLDPLASEFPEWSDYNYVLGNPLVYTDPNGKSPVNNTAGWDTDGHRQLAEAFGSHTGTGMEYQEKKQEEGGGDDKKDPPPGSANYWYDRFTNPDNLLSFKGGVLSTIESMHVKKLAGSGHYYNFSIGANSRLDITRNAGIFKYRGKTMPLPRVGYAGWGRVLGNAGNAISIGYLFQDYNAMQNGQMTGGHFAYNAIGTFGSIGFSTMIGAEFGGLYGAGAGFIFGGVYYTIRPAYLQMEHKFKTEVKQFSGESFQDKFRNAMSYGTTGYF